jgi:hypothetical protein
MDTSATCNAIQERIVLGDALDETNQAHVLACASCSRLFAEWLALDSLVADGIDGGIAVPDGFADRVMAGLEQEAVAASRVELLLGRRWIQLALAHVGLAVAVVNVLRFVLASLVPAMSLGAMR